MQRAIRCIHTAVECPRLTRLSLHPPQSGNLMHALGESISFGRFMSESLSWEKWSTFSHRSYVEEAERYAQPGSVAQKKAFFEAHYKSIAAKKAAALLEQANAANNRAETEFKGQDCDIGTTGSESTINYSQVPADEQLEVKGQSKEEVNRKSNKSIAELKELKIGEVKVSDSVLEENPTKNESLNRLEFPEMEKLLLEDVKSVEEASLPISEVKPEFSSLKSAVYQKAPKVLATTTKPPAPIYSWRENNVTPLTRKSTIDFAEKKRSTKKSLHELIYSTPARESETENNVTPLTRESTIDFVEEKRSTKKSLHELIYSTPARESDKSTTPAATPARESDKSTALAARKIESSRVAPSPYKASKDCKTPSTQMMASTEGNHPSETPCTGNRRSKTPLEPSAYGSNTTGPKWHILSAACSKSLSVCKNKLQSPASFIPFSLRTEERSTRRKQKLEDKFNAKEGQKVKLQTRLKEKAETELGKLRQSLCFKTRPLPDFYKERETTGDQIKNEKTPRSLKLGRKKPSSSALQGIISPPPEEA